MGDSGCAEQHPYHEAVSAGAASDRSFTAAHDWDTPSDRTLKGGLFCGALARPPHSSYDGSGQPRRDSRTTSIRPHFSQRHRRSPFPVSSGSLPSIFIVFLQTTQVIKSSNRLRSSFMCSATATCAFPFSRGGRATTCNARCSFRNV